MRAQTLDLFQTQQADLFAGEAPRNAGSGSANPDHVRLRLRQILEQVETASTLPWDERTTRLNRTIFPQMTRWLPPAEGQALLQAFDRAMARLKAP